MKPASVRRYALSLPDVIEAPHHHFTSFRVGGRIFATMPPGGQFLHVFVDDAQREAAVAADPEVCETLWWGKRVAGLRILLVDAEPAEVKALLSAGWRHKAPRHLVE